MDGRSPFQHHGLGAATLLALTSCLLACDRDTAPAAASNERTALQCPAGQRLDPDRLERLRALVAKNATGRDLLRRAPEPLHVCFGEVPIPAITTAGVFLLDSRLAEAESASRFGHLLHHAVEGMPAADIADRSRSCAAIVNDALQAEAEAHALEMELRRDLAVEAPSRSYPFEEAFWATPAAERVDLLVAFFRAHPAGAGGVPGFVNAYTNRCESRNQ